MDKLQKIKDKLEAIKLSKGSVEFTAFNDFDKAVDAVIDSYGMGINKKDGAKAPIKSALSQLENALSASSRAMSLGISLEKQIKDLGVDEPPKYKSAKSRLLSDEKRIKDAISKLERLQSDLNF